LDQTDEHGGSNGRVENPVRTTPQAARIATQRLATDIARLTDSLRHYHDIWVLATEVQHWLDLARVFGLHLTSLDVRQDARRYLKSWTTCSAMPRFATTSKHSMKLNGNRFLEKTISKQRGLNEEHLEPLTLDALRLFRLLQRQSKRFGPSCFRGACDQHDTLAKLTCSPVLWLCTSPVERVRTGKVTRKGLHRIANHPLFEKIGDLQAAPETLARSSIMRSLRRSFA